MVLPQPCSHQVTDRYHFTSLSVVTAPDAMAASSSSVMSMARLSCVVSEFPPASLGAPVFCGADLPPVGRHAKQMAVVGADPYLNELLVKYCEEALTARSSKQSSFGSNVENVIALHLPHGKARVGEIARKLGVSQRTLARRLSSEGLTFASVLQRLKSDLAKRHLADETLSISEIAWLVGYQDVSAFTHAFKRWTGRAPRAIRQASH